jgi:diguanylate cyclase (GGDEF)-like protein
MPYEGDTITGRNARGSASAASAATTERLAQTLAGLGEVAVQPGPLLQILNAKPNDPDALTEALQRCPVLTSRVLSVTNSAAFGVSRNIDCIRRAVMQLGASRARAIALAFGLRMLAEGTGLPRPLLQRLWVSSLHKAAAARLAAEIFAPSHVDHAYCRALIQDIGLPMLMAVDLPFYETKLLPSKSEGTWSQQEITRFGIDHAAVGARLLAQWNASPVICDAVLHHHNPPLKDAADRVLVKLTGFIASMLPHLSEARTPLEQEWMVALHGQFLSRLYASPKAFERAAAKAAAALCQEDLLRPPVIDPLAMGRLVATVSDDTAGMVAQLCQLETALSQQREHLSALRFEAFTDPLTRVLNRRGFTQLAERRLAEAIKHSLPVCAIMVDLDRFKQVNDTHGHEAGDLVLRGVAKLLRDHLDRSDLIGRLGGDEFAVFFAGVDQAQSEQIAQRLTRACNGTTVPIGQARDVTLHLSLGAVYCALAGKNLSLETLIAAADEQMYACKRAGRSGMIFRALAAD